MDEKMIYDWRFPGNNYTNENGLDTADLQTFMKDPMSSLAREICQNSIDAKLPEKQTAKLEFHCFEIDRDAIPGRNRLEKEVDSCIDYWKEKDSKVTSEKLERIKEKLSQEKVTCLRISDSNTTGLSGINDTENGSFYLLTKGSGVSNKVGTKGGSKGIGKFATFVTSNVNTVFYSTLNQNNEEGYLGISKLCSTRIMNTDEKTIGIGYYGGEKNSAIQEQLELDKEYKRTASGTDIYIIGFKNETGWKEEIITKVLESFMAAIMFNTLEVNVDGVIINKDTISNVVEFYKEKNDIISKSIVSQFLLLIDTKVITKEIPILDYGNVIVKVKPFSSENRDIATNECVMIRSPYMKIKSLKNISPIPFSALCIIEDNALNSILRDIENPEHTDWQVKRIDDITYLNEVKRIKNTLEKNVSNFIKESIITSDNKSTDMDAASQFLPAQGDDLNIGNDEAEIIVEKPKIIKRIKNKVTTRVGNFPDEEGNSYQPEIGTLDSNGQDAVNPNGNNNGGGGEPHNTDDRTGFTDGDDDILTTKQLTGIKYRIICPNKKDGKIIISFNSPYKESYCSINLYYLDSLGTQYIPTIFSANINGKNINIEDNKIEKFSLDYGTTKIEILTDVKELYAWEVNIYANKE